jgi:hypothetical protein
MDPLLALKKEKEIADGWGMAYQDYLERQQAYGGLLAPEMPIYERALRTGVDQVKSYFEPVTDLFSQRDAITGDQLRPEQVYSQNWPTTIEELREPGIYLKPPSEERSDAIGGMLGMADVADVTHMGVPLAGILGKNLIDIGKNVRGGAIVGTPGYTSNRQMSNRQNIVEQLAREGEVGWPWYNRVANFLSEYFAPGPDRHLAGGLLSPTSSSNPVDQNAKDMLRAFSQIKAGQTPQVGLYPGQTKGFLDEWTSPVPKSGYGPVIPGSEYAPDDPNQMAHIKSIFNTAHKWRNFFQNNMGDMTGVTNDRYMKRLAGFYKNGMTDKQYDYISALVRDSADRIGITPAEAQAGAWTSFKARWDAVQPKHQRYAVKKGWWDDVKGDVKKEYREQFHDRVFKDAMKHEPTPEELANAGADLSDFIGEANLPGEFIPGKDFDHIPELLDASQADQDAYHEMMDGIFIDQETGRNRIFDSLGIPHKVTPRTSGSYQGQTSPGYHLQILLPENSAGEVYPEILERLKLGIATMGRTTRQEAFGFYKFEDVAMPDADLFQINLGRTLTDKETSTLELAMNDLGLPGTVIPINQPHGVDLYYTTDVEGAILNMEEFQSAIHTRLDDLDWLDESLGFEYQTHFGRHKGEYLNHKSITGKDYTDGSRTSHWESLAQATGGGEESERLYDLFSQQVKEAEIRFTQQRGWRNPYEEITEQVGPVLGPEFPPNRGLLDER